MIVIAIPYEEMIAGNRSQLLLQDLSLTLNTITLYVRTKENENKIEPWTNDPRGVQVKTRRRAADVWSWDDSDKQSKQKRSLDTIIYGYVCN